jgi:hypothetical protein
VSDTARLDVVLRCQLHAIVAAIARRYRRHVDCYLPSSGFEEIVQAWTWLHSTPAMGADGITALAKERDWYRRTVRRWGDV